MGPEVLGLVREFPIFLNFTAPLRYLRALAGWRFRIFALCDFRDSLLLFQCPLKGCHRN